MHEAVVMRESIRQNPEAALKDPYFSTPEGLDEYLFGQWTFGLPDETARRAGDVAVQLARGRGLKYEVQALKRRGTAYRRTNTAAARRDYQQALLLQHEMRPDQKCLADTYRRIGILEGEEGRWAESDIRPSHRRCLVGEAGPPDQSRSIGYMGRFEARQSFQGR